MPKVLGPYGLPTEGTNQNGLFGGSRSLRGAYTVAKLPTAASSGAGARAYVSDANATTFGSGVVGGGANKVPVYSNGSAWLIG